MTEKPTETRDFLKIIKDKLTDNPRKFHDYL